MAYFWLKSFHIVAVVAWFAGLFYLPRLFVYHAQALAKPEAERSALTAVFLVMEKRLYRGIMTPAMIAATAFAIGILYEEPGVMAMPWFRAKVGLVLLLVIYHLFLGEVVAMFAAGTCTWSDRVFRVLNEIPTVLLIAIVLLAIFKDALPGGALIAVIVSVSVLLLLGIAVYGRVRTRAAGERGNVMMELQIVLCLVGVAAAICVPQWNRVRQDSGAHQCAVHLDEIVAGSTAAGVCPWSGSPYVVEQSGRTCCANGHGAAEFCAAAGTSLAAAHPEPSRARTIFWTAAGGITGGAAALMFTVALGAMLISFIRDPAGFWRAANRRGF